MREVDIVALIVNAEIAKDFYESNAVQHQWILDLDFSSLRIPCELLNPLCSTLKELILKERSTKISSITTSIQTNGCAFALRHLPKLENLDVYAVITVDVVKLLYTLRDVDQKPFEKALKEAANFYRLVAASSSFTFFSGK